MLLEKLADKKNLPDWLYDAIAGWLVSDDSKEEKEKQLWEKFGQEVTRSNRPSREAYRSYRRFSRTHGLEEVAPVGAPLRRRIILRVAAVVIPALIVTAGVFLTLKESITTAPIAMVQISGGTPQAGQTESGHTEYILPDRSTVRLAEGSKLAHAEDFEGNRYVELEGEAHFNVTKTQDENKRFTVHTGHLQICVLGTEFGVHCPADGEYSTLSLLHGSVEVRIGERLIPMSPGEHLRYNRTTGESSLSGIALNERRYDRMPGLVFSKAPIAEVFRTIETGFGVHFLIDGDINADPTLLDGDLSALHSLEEVMSAISRLSGSFDYHIDTENIRIKTLETQ